MFFLSFPQLLAHKLPSMSQGNDAMHSDLVLLTSKLAGTDMKLMFCVLHGLTCHVQHI